MALGIEIIYALLILARMSGFVFFSSIFGRTNIPGVYKTILSIMLTMAVYSLLPAREIIVSSYIELSLLVAKELFIGFLISYITNMFFGLFTITGEVMGMQIGISMTQIYNPQTNISMGLIGSFFNVLAMMIFFLGNGHITLIHIIITSCKLIDIGSFSIPPQLFLNMVELLSQILVLALKLSMPIVAIQIIVESGIGILMKVVPQIQVFSVNIQVKLLVGLFMLPFLMPVFSSFTEKTMTLMFDQLQKNLSALM